MSTTRTSSLLVFLLLLVLVGAAWSVQWTHNVNQILTLTPEEKEILSHMSIEYLDDGKGGLVKTIRFTAVNLQVVSGLGATNGYPADPYSTDPGLTQVNGLGNLIVGYNELRNSGDDRTGSHNLVLGITNNYLRFGGVILGTQNQSSEIYASVLGGSGNTAAGKWSSILGGDWNVASGVSSCVSGGLGNTSAGNHASILGGDSNQAAGNYSCLGGGQDNDASGTWSSVLGGLSNEASGAYSAVAGGEINLASRRAAVVLGGRSNSADFDDSTVCGGEDNSTLGLAAVVSGGFRRTAGGTHDWRAGSCFFCDN